MYCAGASSCGARLSWDWGRVDAADGVPLFACRSLTNPEEGGTPRTAEGPTAAEAYITPPVLEGAAVFDEDGLGAGRLGGGGEVAVGAVCEAKCSSSYSIQVNGCRYMKVME